MKAMNDIKHATLKQVAYIQRNINKMPFHVMRNNLRVSTGIMYEWVKKIYEPDKQVVVDDDGNELHSHYLVTLDKFNYIVVFNVPVDYKTIQYCKHSIKFDYTVSKLGVWEYNHLRYSTPVVAIKADANYVFNFWNSVKLWHE